MQKSAQYYRPNMDSLEARITPSYNASFVNDLVTVTQTAPGGDITVEIDGSGDVIVTEGASTLNLGDALGSLSVNMLSGSPDDLTIRLTSGLFGNLTVNLGNGARELTFDGTGNTILGNLRITAGTGSQTVNLSDGAAAAFDAGGTAFIDLGLSADTLTADNGFGAGSNVTINRVNTFNDGTSFGSGGSVSFSDGGENQTNTLTLDGTVAIGNRFTYYGGNGSDVVTLDGRVGTSAYLRMGNGTNTFTLTGASTIGSTFTYYGGSGVDTVLSNDLGNVIGSTININTGFLGNNVVNIAGTTGARSAVITTGLGNDAVTYNMDGFAYLRVSLSLGNDALTIGSNASLYYLYADFGFGSDTYTKMAGSFVFRKYLRSLP